MTQTKQSNNCTVQRQICRCNCLTRCKTKFSFSNKERLCHLYCRYISFDIAIALISFYKIS